MREIKFRAWDKKELLYDEMFCFFPSGNFYILDKNAKGEMELRAGEDWVLMQYTGLKDKNGKEIYEGDIVDGRRYYRPALYGRREVKQDHDGCWNLSRWRNEVEVIGNIYENPELLK